MNRASLLSMLVFLPLASLACGRQPLAPVPGGGASPVPGPVPAPKPMVALPLNYNRDVRPIFSDKCFSCHGPDEQKRDGGFRLDEWASATRPVKDSGLTPIVPGDPAHSEMWVRIMHDDPAERMPPAKTHKSLTEGEKEILRRWIAEGARYEKHWAFVAPVRPPMPEVRLKDWARNPVDLFILSKLEREGFAPSPEADKETLLRRVSLDLTGLPPTPAEMDAFLADASPDAYEKQVDRLLASPRFGERMATPWLDAARYADSNGYLQNYRRTTWPWRDWVIKAFNDDKPFDQFVTEQLAGDLLPGATEEQKIATCFNRNHPISVEGGTIVEEYENEYACDRVQTVGTALLGLSLGCARCHDHKFDPVPTENFYALKAYFNASSERHHPDSGSRAATPPFISAASPLVLGGDKVQVMVMDELPIPNPTFILKRGQYDQPDKSRPVTRHTPEALNPMPAGAPANRLGLAQWITAKDQPLMPRVTVNLWWAQIFGTGLVKTTDDFGLQGEYPSHPELLDWLACELRDGHGAARPWGVKHVWRTLVTSAVYRQSSAVPPALRAKDPANRWLGRFPRQRLTAEMLRDQSLYVAGVLHEQLGGEPVFPPQPEGLWEERANRDTTPYPGSLVHYPTSVGTQARRRSVYTFVNRTCPPPAISTFDGPDRTICVAKRSGTNTPLQALALQNDPQQLLCARALAARVLRDALSDEDRLSLMFRLATARRISDASRATLTQGFVKLKARYAAAPMEAETLLAQCPEPFAPVANPVELAAWMLVASTILNLDQTLVRD